MSSTIPLTRTRSGVGHLQPVAAIVTAVLADMTGPATLTTGQPIEIELAGPRDVDRVRDFYDKLSDTATYYRFFGIRRALPDDELRALVIQRLPDHVTLLASIDGRLIGIGEYVAGDDADEVQVAFAVADDHRHEGVATLLLERVAMIAHRCGVKRLTARTLPGNVDMQLVFRTVGLPEQQHFDPDDGIIHIVLDLAGIDDMLVCAAARNGRAWPRPIPAITATG
jgi:GNAT superfamily N-acetyltransferase